ncbi:hypothetical protein [Bacillus sp. FJAT-29814]|nr:hypothetical protein [Bacillus sp. FJAT-29814]
MSKDQVTIVRKDTNGEGAIKIIEWNVTDPAESTFAVVTPVKMK